MKNLLHTLLTRSSLVQSNTIVINQFLEQAGQVKRTAWC